MTELRYLRIQFANELRDYELPYFRSAIIEATNRQHDRFHNHNEESRSIFRYPLIQYKTIQGKAALVCLGEAVDDIHSLLELPELRIRIGRREDDLIVDKVKIEKYRVQLWDHRFNYSLHHWLPLHSSNFKHYTSLETDEARLEELQRILTGNLLSFCKGIGHWLDNQLYVQIKAIKKQSIVKFKDYNYKSFSIDFLTNLSIPPHTGIGKGASLGYGITTRSRLNTVVPVDGQDEMALEAGAL